MDPSSDTCCAESDANGGEKADDAPRGERADTSCGEKADTSCGEKADDAPRGEKAGDVGSSGLRTG